MTAEIKKRDRIINCVKSKIAKIEECLRSTIFDGLIPGQIYEISLRTIYKNRVSSIASNQFTTFY